MNIAHIVWTLSIGGIQTMLVDIVNEQIQTQKVGVFVVNDLLDESLVDKIDKRVKLFRCNRKPGSKNLIPLLKLNWLLHTFRPDVIHCHEDRLTDLFFYNKVPMVRTIHNTHSCPKEYSRFKRLCCISQSVKEYTASQGFSKSVVVYNGIHTDQITMRTSPSAITMRKRIVCVGRLHPMKGQRLLIEAVNEIVNERNIKNFAIDLIGDGEQRKELEELTSSYKLNNYIHFYGRKLRDWFYPRLCNYDLFVLPSISEGFGLTLAEACAAKIPVLTCDLQGPMEVIANGCYGRFFKAGDSHSLANELELFMENGAEQQMVENAYNYVKKNFDVAVTSQKYLMIYQEVLMSA